MKKRKVSGSVLGVVLMLTMLLAIITAVVASNTLQNYKTTNWATDSGTSRYIAFAGLQHAMLKLRDDPTFNKTFDGNVPGRPELHYHVTIKNQKNLVGTTNKKTGMTDYSRPYDTAEIPADSAKIEAQVIMSTGAVDRTLSGVVGTAVWKPTGFVNAASARSSVIIEGASGTSAYDFTKYGNDSRDSQSTKMDSGYVDPATAKTDGAHIQTNQQLVLADTSKVQGDVITPPPPPSSNIGAAQAAAAQAEIKVVAPDVAAAMATPSNPVKGTNYTGTMKPGTPNNPVPATAPFKDSEATAVLSDFPGTTETYTETYYDDKGKKQTRTVTRVVPPTLPPNQAYKSITVPKDQTLVLTAGQYYVSDEFKVDGTILVDDGGRGDVIFYVGKRMTVNGDVNFYGDPAKMQVYFTDKDKPLDPKTGLPILNALGFSTLNMNPGSRSTMVAQGAGLISRLDGARLLGAVSAEAVWLKNKADIEYDTNLKGRQMAGGSSWKLQGVYETVGL